MEKLDYQDDVDEIEEQLKVALEAYAAPSFEHTCNCVSTMI